MVINDGRRRRRHAFWLPWWDSHFVTVPGSCSCPAPGVGTEVCGWVQAGNYFLICATGRFHVLPDSDVRSVLSSCSSILDIIHARKPNRCTHCNDERQQTVVKSLREGERQWHSMQRTSIGAPDPRTFCGAYSTDIHVAIAADTQSTTVPKRVRACYYGKRN